VAQWTVVPSERGEDDGALVRLMAMLEEILEHDGSFVENGLADIGVPP
jgi:hypothetical protein